MTAVGPRMLLVRSGQRRWAVPLDRVIHVGPAARLARLPNAPPGMMGALAFRGDVVPVHDLAGLVDGVPDASGKAVDGKAGGEKVAGGMLLLVHRLGQRIGLHVSDIEEIRAATADEATMLEIDALPCPDEGGARPPPSNHVEPKPAPADQPEERGLAVAVAGQTLWLPLASVVEVMDRFEAIAVPWADPRVPEIVIRGASVHPIVRIGRLVGQAPVGQDAGPGEALPSGPLILVRRAAGPVAFRVDQIGGIVPRGAGPAPVDLDALLAGLPQVGTNSAAVPAGSVADARRSSPYLSFLLSGQACLLPMPVVRAVSEHRRPAGLPRRGGRASVVQGGGIQGGGILAGLRAIRGQILPVLDPCEALGLPRERMPAADIVVAAAGLPSFVLPVHAIDGVVRLTEAAWDGTGRAGLIEGLVRIDGRLSWLLNPAALTAAAGGGA